MDVEGPDKKRCVSFFDGQNLYRHAKEAFGYHHPNYDPAKLAKSVCDLNKWECRGIRFYTGVPDYKHSAMWHGYWSNRLLAMRRAGILVTHRAIRYREEEIIESDGTTKLVTTPQEKGIDVRIALDVIRLALNRQYDVALIFSQDQDLHELVEDIKDIARAQNRWIKLACAFPAGPDASFNRGIAGTDWIRLERVFYDQCLDHRDYRPKITSAANTPSRL